MILNEFLNCRLGVVFDDKYNELAVNEVISNTDKYPFIAPYVKNMSWGSDFESGFFDCDDPEYCADFEETFELYQTFVRAFLHDINGKNYKVSFASYGVVWLTCPSVSGILDGGVNYSGCDVINIFLKNTELFKALYYPYINEDPQLGFYSMEKTARVFSESNDELLNQLTEDFRQMAYSNLLFVNRLDNDELIQYQTVLENAILSYPVDFYEFEINDNLLRFFCTERGFDAFGCVRNNILSLLSKEAQEHAIVRDIKSKKYRR